MRVTIQFNCTTPPFVDDWRGEIRRVLEDVDWQMGTLGMTCRVPRTWQQVLMDADGVEIGEMKIISSRKKTLRTIRARKPDEKENVRL